MSWQVPVISQRTPSLCWEACARMLWGWHHGNKPDSSNMYAKRAGNYTRMNQGLSEQHMDAYYRQLGIRSLQRPLGKNILHALQWSPVIVTSISQVQGHALVVIGYNSGKYEVINPCAVQMVNFGQPGEGSCTAASTMLPDSEIDNKLGKYIWYW